jgi:hypothetical protein
MEVQMFTQELSERRRFDLERALTDALVTIRNCDYGLIVLKRHYSAFARVAMAKECTGITI